MSDRFPPPPGSVPPPPGSAPPPSGPAAGGVVQMACFVVGAQTYGLDIMQIAEVINPVSIAPVPGAPAFIEGIATLRGAFLAVVDLRKRFGLPAPSPTRDAKYVVVSLDGYRVGLIVDAVRDVRRVDAARIQPPPIPPSAGAGMRRFFSGVVTAGDDIVMVLDLDQVLSADERHELREIGAPATVADDARGDSS